MRSQPERSHARPSCAAREASSPERDDDGGVASLALICHITRLTGKPLSRITLLLVFTLGLAAPHTAATERSTSSCAGRGGTARESASFDGERAYAHVKRLVEMGPRPAGSAASRSAARYIERELKSYGLKVARDEFTADTPAGKRRMANVTAELAGDGRDFIILASHYDTKLFEDFRFVGANDGGSSTGALLELARVLASSKRPRPLTYRFVFFDGEEAFCREWDECGTPAAPDNTYGSRRYVERLRRSGELKNARALVLLDMVGYKHLKLGRDTMSTPWLVDLIWGAAREMGCDEIFVETEEAVGGDDHEPFLAAGVPSVDIIQLNSYPHWHTPGDTLDKISPDSLRAVGEVVLASLPRIEERLSKGARAGGKSSNEN